MNGSGYIKGIDVSEHNGVIDWEKVKASGAGFAIIRGGYGKKLDKQFKRNIKECSRVGLPCGVYWFSYALNAADAAREAAVCLDAIQPYKIDFPVAFDLEYDSVKYAQEQGGYIDLKLASDMVRAFCRTVREKGFYAANYANPDYLNRYFDNAVKSEFPVWLAQWPNGTPSLDKPPKKCEIWQYSAKGSVPGISGPVDLDVCYAEYPKNKELDEMTQEQFNKMFAAAMDAYCSGLRDSKDNNEWSRKAREYVIRKGIFTGFGAGADGKPNYMWDGLLTREQAAQIMFRFAKLAGLAEE